MADSSIDRLNMYRFGTLRWQPTPNALYQTAVHNLAKAKSRMAIKGDRARAKAAGADPKHQGSASAATAFLLSHLADATRPSDMLRAAIKGVNDGRRSRNVETLTVYQNLEALHEALAIAERVEADAGSHSQAAEPESRLI